MSKLLMTVNLARAKSLAAAARKLGVPARSLDADYGVVEVDPDLNLFAVQVEAAALAAASGALRANDGKFHGPFSNPRIQTFGPRTGSGKP